MDRLNYRLSHDAGSRERCAGCGGGVGGEGRWWWLLLDDDSSPLRLRRDVVRPGSALCAYGKVSKATSPTAQRAPGFTTTSALVVITGTIQLQLRDVGNTENRSPLPRRYASIPVTTTICASSYRPYLILAIRPQEHDRRRPPQLPQQPQVQADPHTDRCTVSPRLHGRHHRRRTLLLRLEVRLGSQQALHTACCRRILSVEYRIQLLAMVRGEGCSV